MVSLNSEKKSFLNVSQGPIQQNTCFSNVQSFDNKLEYLAMKNICNQASSLWARPEPSKVNSPSLIRPQHFKCLKFCGLIRLGAFTLDGSYRGARKLTGEILKLVWAVFLTVS
jgi:hypothetical protein